MKNKIDINVTLRFAYLMDLIWLVDVLNLKGFEFLDTTFGLNTLFWTIVWVFSIIKVISERMIDNE